MWSECKMHCHRFLELYITVFITQADWIIVVSDQISKTETHVCQMVKQDRVPGGAIFIMQTCCLGITCLVVTTDQSPDCRLLHYMLIMMNYCKYPQTL